MTSRTVVVGAGAAGIAAARTLHDAGGDVLLIEAAAIIGGRARSMCLPLPSGSVTVDLGCGWLHSGARNPWVGIAEEAGLVVDRSPPHWREQWQGRGFAPADQAAFNEAYRRWSEAAQRAAVGEDRPLSAIPIDPRWQPMLEAISGYANGASLAEVSLHDWAAYEGAAGEENWSLPNGYGTLVAGHAAGVPTRCDTVVTRIDHGARMLRIETSRGTIEAARAIVCVPTPVLDRIAFDPPLPAKREAAAALPLGLANKVFLAVDRPEWPANAHLIGNPHDPHSFSHRLSPFGWPIIESFVGGSGAEAMEHENAGAALAIEELVALLGNSWRQRLRPVATTRWRREPFVHGSYSHARLGAAPQRAVLAAPIDDRLFFAGEACHPTDFSTAHGAYETGVAAARAVLGLRGDAGGVIGAA